MNNDSSCGRSVITGEFEFQKFSDGEFYLNTPNGKFSLSSREKFKEKNFCLLCFGFYEPFPILPEDKLFAFVPKGKPNDLSKKTRWDIFQVTGTMSNPVRNLYKN